MGVYIDGLNMPKSCNKCPFTCEALQFFNGKDRPQSCPLIEIATCGECEWYDKDFKDCNIRDSYGWEYKPTDFCSYGERRADDERL